MIVIERTPPVTPPASGSQLDVLTVPRPRLLQSISPLAARAILAPSSFGRLAGYFKPVPGTAPIGGRGCGINWTSPATRSYQPPNPAAAEAPDRAARTRLVGTALEAVPAGVFSNLTPTVRRDRGFLFDCTWARRTSPNGSRGGIGPIATLGPDLEPSQAGDSVMVGYDSTDTDGIYYLHHHQGGVVGANLTRIPIPLAPRLSNRIYRFLLACEAGGTSMTATLLDVSDPTAWAVCLDVVLTANLPGAAVLLGFELNASPGPDAAGVGQSAQTLDILDMEVWTR